MPKDDEGESVIEIAYKCFGKDETWDAIKECLDGAGTKKVLLRNPNTNMYPFMLAAEGSSTHLDVVYYLLRKDPVAISERNGP